MGIVYKCEDTASGQQVALKTFKQDYLSVRVIREQFLDEAVNWVLLGVHPNLVRAIGITQLHDPPQPFIILEWVEGRYPDADPSLATVLNRRKQRPLGFLQSLGIALGIARGMRHATETLPDFVHNDLKPENILIDANWHPRITDMGMSNSRASIAKKTGAAQRTLFPCTPGFCAPEQYDPERSVDQRADIYALGCILYEMLTGQRINPGQDIDSRSQFDRERRLRDIPTALPACIRKIIDTCIQPDSADRYDSWAAIESEITACHQEIGGKPPEAVNLPVESIDEMSRERGNAFLMLGMSFSELGDMARAMQYIDKGLSLARERKDPQLITQLLFQRGIIQLESGKLQAAFDDLESVLSIARDGEDKELLADVLSVLGMLYVRREDYDNAMDFLQQALDIARESRNRETEIYVLGNLGSAYGQSGKPEKAIAYFSELLKWCDENEHESLRSQTLASLGVACYDLKQYSEAIDYLNESRSLCRQHGDDPGYLHVLQHLWQSYAAQHMNEEARSAREEYENLAMQLGRS